MEQIDQQIEAMVLLRKAIRQESRLQLFSAFLLLVFGAILSYFFFNQNRFLSILGLVAVLVGARLTHLFFLSTQCGQNKVNALASSAARENRVGLLRRYRANTLWFSAF